MILRILTYDASNTQKSAKLCTVNTTTGPHIDKTTPLENCKEEIPLASDCEAFSPYQPLSSPLSRPCPHSFSPHPCLAEVRSTEERDASRARNSLSEASRGDAHLDTQITTLKEPGEALSPDRSEITKGVLLPGGSQLVPSSFLGKMLYLQYLGHIPEVQAATLYREVLRRIPNEGELHRSLADFKFLQNERVCVGEKDPSLAEGVGEKDPSLGEGVGEKPLSSGTSSLYCDGDEAFFKGTLPKLDTSSICQLLQECLVAMSAKDASLMMLIEGPYDRCVLSLIVHLLLVCNLR